MFTANANRKNRLSQFTLVAALAITASTLSLAGVRHNTDLGQKVPGGGHAYGRGSGSLVKVPRGGALPGSGATTVATDALRVQPRFDETFPYIVTIDPPNGGAQTSDPATTVDGLRKNDGNNGRRHSGEYIVSVPRGGAMPGSGTTTVTTDAMTTAAPSRFDISAGGTLRVNPAYIRNTSFAGSDAAGTSGASLSLSGEGGRSIQAAVSFTLR